VDDNPTGTSADLMRIRVTLTDDDGGTAESTAEVTVRNVAPTLSDLRAVGTPTVGQPTQFRLTLTDPGLADVHTLTITWGDSTRAETITLIPGTRDILLERTYQRTGNFLLVVRATDDDGGVSNFVTLRFAVAPPTTLSSGATQPIQLVSARQIMLSTAETARVRAPAETQFFEEAREAFVPRVKPAPAATGFGAEEEEWIVLPSGLRAPPEGPQGLRFS
jgi:hypothetical protein